MLPIRNVDPALLLGLLQARVSAPEAPLTGPLLDHQDVAGLSSAPRASGIERLLHKKGCPLCVGVLDEFSD